MRASIIILVAMFCNFFGWFIVQKYSQSVGLDSPTLFDADDYFFESIVEMLMVFICAVLFYFFTIRKKINKKISVHFVFVKGWQYYILTSIFLVFSIINFMHTNLSFDVSMRGVGQLDRSASSSLTRISLLLFPALVFYRLAYERFKIARWISIVYVLSVIINSISLGDRRILFYYLVVYLFIKLRNNDANKGGMSSNISIFLTMYKRSVFAILLVSLLVGSYLIRAREGFESIGSLIGYGLLQGTLGGLGIGAILPQIKQIIHEHTGYLMGASFYSYAWSLFIPSFVLYAFGGDEFYFRSSFEFDKIFNDNPNQGYDFMMLSDFYWNFGYVGYVLYLLFVFYVIKLVVKWERDKNVLKFGSAIILTAFFVAGQRSDFGFFLKSSVYCLLFYYVLNFCARKRLI